MMGLLERSGCTIFGTISHVAQNTAIMDVQRGVLPEILLDSKRDGNDRRHCSFIAEVKSIHPLEKKRLSNCIGETYRLEYADATFVRSLGGAEEFRHEIANFQARHSRHFQW